MPGIQFWPRQPCGGGLVIVTLWAADDGSLAIMISAEDGERDVIPIEADDLHDFRDSNES